MEESKVAARKPRKQSDNARVIDHFVKIPFKPDKFFWGREATLAKRLLDKFPVDDLLSFKMEKVDSLAIIVALPRLEFEIKRAVGIKNFKNLERKEWVLGEKIGEDLPVKRKIRSIRDL